jgi:thioesterase domain-containing protein
VLFRSSRLQERYPNDPRAGWRHITPSIETCDIAGDHWTCVTTHAADVAGKMAARL